MHGISPLMWFENPHVSSVWLWWMLPLLQLCLSGFSGKQIRKHAGSHHVCSVLCCCIKAGFEKLCKHTYIHKYMHTCTQHTHTYAQTSTCTYMHKHTIKYLYAYIHTQAHMRTHLACWANEKGNGRMSAGPALEEACVPAFPQACTSYSYSCEVNGGGSFLNEDHPCLS